MAPPSKLFLKLSRCSITVLFLLFRYKVTKVNDVEAASPLGADFDPFKVRVIEHPVS